MDNNSYSHQEKYGEPVGLYQQGAPSQVVSHQPVTTYMTSSSEPEWSWCHLVTSVFSIFCCQIFGFIATVMAILSYTDHRVKDFTGFRSKKSCALGFAIAGIVIGCLIIVICIIIFAVSAAQATKHVYSHPYWNN